MLYFQDIRPQTENGHEAVGRRRTGHGCCSETARDAVLCIYIIDLLNFVFLRDCPSLASQSSNFHITCGTFPAFPCFLSSFVRNTKRQQ